MSIELPVLGFKPGPKLGSIRSRPRIQDPLTFERHSVCGFPAAPIAPNVYPGACLGNLPPTGVTSYPGLCPGDIDT